MPVGAGVLAGRSPAGEALWFGLMGALLLAFLGLLTSLWAEKFDHAAAVTRAVLVGFAVWLAMLIWPGVSVDVRHLDLVLWFGLMGAFL